MSSDNDVTTSTGTTTTTTLLGRVKWFNSKAGYGFITVTDGEKSGSDIFVHHSAVNVENQQYRYLVQGEYVEFSLTKTEGGAHEFQAANVCGIKGGKLMCETRREFKLARTTYKSSDAHEEYEEPRDVLRMPRQQRPPNDNSTPRVRGEGPRDDTKGWTVVTDVKKASAPKPRGRPPRAPVVSATI